MMIFSRTFAFFACLAFWLVSVTAVFAQEDKDFLTRTIQDALSGAGREVSIDGFTGALSSEASFDQMTISDADGVWLTLTDVRLDWNRSALLRGRLEVERLSAGALDIPRLPQSEAQELPDAKAEPFSLPELPVSLRIEQFVVEQITLGAPLLGAPVALKVEASALLNGDEGRVDFQADRIDGKQGSFDIKADLTRADQILTLLLNLQEQEEGIAARLLNLPDQPSVEMTIDGSGPLDDFTTNIRIATNGAERLAGDVTFGAQESRRNVATPDRRIQADIGGDITALLAPQYRDFFGENIGLKVDALIEGSGAVEVSEFALDAQAANLAGQVTLNEDKWPSFIAITGQIANPDGTPILLPGGGDGTTVEGVDLKIDYDADEGETFAAAFDITALETSGVSIARTTLGLDGILQGNVGSVGQFLGDFSFDANGLALLDAASAEAIGDAITGRAQINYIEGSPVRIEDLDLSGADYGLSGNVVINDIESGLLTRLDARLEATDISRFSALAGREIDGAAALDLKGTVTPLSGAFELEASGTAADIAVGIAQADAVMAGETMLSMQATRDETGTFLRDLLLVNDALLFTGDAELRGDTADVQAQFQLQEIGLVVPQYEGPVSVSATATQDASGWRVDARTEGPYRAALSVDGLVTGPNANIRFGADVPDVTPFAAGFDQDISGPLQATGTLRQTPEGWLLDTDAQGPFDVAASIDGLVAPKIDVNFALSAPDVKPIVPQLDGPLRAEGQLRQEGEAFYIDTNASGPYGARAAVEGIATGPDMSLTFDVAVPDVSPLAPGINGGANAKGNVRQTPQGIAVDTNVTGPYGARAAVEGLATGPNMSLTFDVSVPDVSPLAPGVSGAVAAKGVVRQTPQGISVDTNATGPYASRASVQGVVTGPNAAVDFDVAVSNVAALTGNISGPLSVTGSARKQGTAWRLDTDARGPSGTQARIAGLVQGDGTLNLDLNGSAPLGLSRPFIEPRSLQGQAQFDLAVNGPPALSSVTGTISTNDARLTLPNLRLALTNIATNITLAGSRANVNISGQGTDGGAVQVGGGITLSGALPADLQVGLRDLVLIDPRLYRTSVSGDLRIAGPLTGGARIAGQVNIGETIVNVPATGLTSIGDIPQITHLNDSAAAEVTRRKAGLSGADAGDDPAASGGGGGGFGLNVNVNAPNRIFVRGRGLDAELGGGLLLTGTTSQIISAGRFDLLRGRLDILGKRFDLREGSARFQGDLVPFIRFVSATDTPQGEVRVVVEGPADSPVVTFESTPAQPQDEVLAQLLFGRNISEISPFQALQLASAVATLAGRGGDGIIGNLRDGFGLDDLDVTTTDSGATALRVGKYISDNIYTDVTAASDGRAEISLNIDITESLKARGKVGSAGDTSIGIFFEKDY